jgi:hypothetical protein
MPHPPLVELLWFDGCPNHASARARLVGAIARLAPGTPFVDIDASDPAVAAALRFPGSPTIRIDGADVDPTFVGTDDFTPLCRLYLTRHGLRGAPELAWIDVALAAAVGARRVGWHGL